MYVFPFLLTFQNVLDVLKEDNLKQELSLYHRFSVEKEIFLFEKKPLLFQVCALNFIRSCYDGSHSNMYSFLESIKKITRKELSGLLKVFWFFYMLTS
jgi:hypothetical protein